MAPANGWFSVHCGSNTSGNSYIEFVGDGTFPDFGTTTATTNYGIVMRLFTPCKKGTYVHLWYSNIADFYHFRFYYIEGQRSIIKF